MFTERGVGHGVTLRQSATLDRVAPVLFVALAWITLGSALHAAGLWGGSAQALRFSVHALAYGGSG